MNAKSDSLRKRPTMVVAVALAWLFLATRYNPMLMPLFSEPGGLTGIVLTAVALCWINVVWFYGVFHLVGVLFSLATLRVRSVTPSMDHEPSVAILYTTCNDFDPDAATSCLKQNYTQYHLFLLDDSTDERERQQVSEFAVRHAPRTTVLRRQDRAGFKAGNLNAALRAVGGRFDFFAVVDADEVLPVDFLAVAVAAISSDPTLGFVQADHRYRQSGVSRFARTMTRCADLHWRTFMPARNRFGFVMFYGHGALVRTASWRACGGFPQSVCEDLAFSTRLREHGYGGRFLPELVAEESFPASYGAFLRRESRVVLGTWDFVRRQLRSFLASRRVTLVEKLDLVASISVLFLPLYFVVFLLVANVLVPLRNLSMHSGLDLAMALRTAEPLGASLKELWSWDFYLLTVVSIVAPLFYQVRAFVSSPLGALACAARATTIYLSAITVVALELVRGITGKSPIFDVTGDRRRRSSHPRARSTLAVVFGVVILSAGVITRNVALLTVALSSLLLPLLLRCSWDQRLTRAAVVLPCVFFLAAFGSIPFLLLGIAGAMAAVVPAHH